MEDVDLTAEAEQTLSTLLQGVTQDPPRDQEQPRPKEFQKFILGADQGTKGRVSVLSHCQIMAETNWLSISALPHKERHWRSPIHLHSCSATLPSKSCQFSSERGWMVERSMPR